MVSACDNLEFNGRNWRTSILTFCRISGQGQLFVVLVHRVSQTSLCYNC
jgi:hypothetical protein